MPQVCERTGLSKSTIYKWADEGRFPTPLTLGSKAVGFVEKEVNDWMEEQIAKRPGKKIEGSVTGAP